MGMGKCTSMGYWRNAINVVLQGDAGKVPGKKGKTNGGHGVRRRDGHRAKTDGLRDPHRRHDDQNTTHARCRNPAEADRGWPTGARGGTQW